MTGHDEQEKFQCHECGFIVYTNGENYINDSGLQLLPEPVLFNGSMMYPCGKCGLKYRYKRSRDAHQRSECDQVRRFKCPFCEYKSNRRAHVRAHCVTLHSDGQHLKEFFKKHSI